MNIPIVPSNNNFIIGKYIIKKILILFYFILGKFNEVYIIIIAIINYFI